MVRTIFLGLSALTLSACASTAPAGQTIAVTGSVTYRERIALPPTARIEVKLDDVSLADAPSRTLASQRFAARSDEHTSELQSLMRISYAVFCLKKKTHIPHY